MQPLPDDERYNLTRRLAPLFLVLVLFLVVVAGRILYLQTVQGEEFKKLSDVNRITHETVPAPRGAITDRRGEILAADQPVFQLVKKSRPVAERKYKIEKLARLLRVDTGLLSKRLHDPERQYVLRSLTDEQRIRFEERTERYPDLKVSNYPRRVYRNGKVLGPVIGYTGEINPRELVNRRREGLSQGDIVGKAGVEKSYDAHLRGEEGMRWIETTATGKYIRTLSNPRPIKPRRGKNLQLNLDLQLQKLIARAFPADSQGAAVVMELPEGRLRALYSQPSYSPEIFVQNGAQNVRELLRARGDPLINRAVQSRFPPGSTFKMVPFLAALEAESYAPSQTFYCSGSFRLGTREFECWEEDGHGRLNLLRGVVHSCNVYFYKLARKLGYDKIMKMARKLSYSKKTGIDLPEEKSSQLSTPRLAREKYGTTWTEGEALNGVIGQGYTLVSPIKQAVVLSTILSGRGVVPAVAQRHSGRVHSKFQVPEETRELFLQTLDRVTEEGTGYWAQHTPDYRKVEPEIVGKTGTVQKATKADDETDTPPADAWFVSAAPVDSPRYVVVVYLGNAGSAGHSAAPLAREVYQALEKLNYFSESGPKTRAGVKNIAPEPRRDTTVITGGEE